MNRYIIDLWKSFIKWLAWWIWIFIWILSVFAVTWPVIVPSWEVPWGAFMNYFNKMLVNTWATTDWTVKKAESLWLNGSTAIVAISWWKATTSLVPVWNNDIVNKAYVDSVIAAWWWSLWVYKWDWTTYLWKFIQLKNAYESDNYADVEQIVYVDASWNIQRIWEWDRMQAGDYWEYYKDANCTWTKYVIANINNWTLTYKTVRAKADWLYYKYSAWYSCSIGWYWPIYRWNFTNSTCVLVWSSENYCAYNTAWYVPKLCWQWDCKIK